MLILTAFRGIGPRFGRFLVSASTFIDHQTSVPLSRKFIQASLKFWMPIASTPVVKSRQKVSMNYLILSTWNLILADWAIENLVVVYLGKGGRHNRVLLELDFGAIASFLPLISTAYVYTRRCELSTSGHAVANSSRWRLLMTDDYGS